MINISRYLNSESIITDIDANTKEEAIKVLVEKMCEKEGGDRPFCAEDVYEAVISRESLQSTGIGDELAFPHARIEGWGDLSIVMGVLKDDVDFNSLDGRPVRFIFLMVSSVEKPYLILQAMSAIVRFLGSADADGEVTTDEAKIERLIEKIQEQDISTTDVVLARDIARPVKYQVSMRTPIEDVTRMMHFKHESILPVVHDDGRFYSEITCNDIFSFGMPDFFRELNTISFVKHIDPFEKYFNIKKGLTVSDVLKEGTAPIDGDTTLMEIVFEMSVRNRAKLFMVDSNGVLEGVIDRYCVIDKILFF